MFQFLERSPPDLRDTVRCVWLLRADGGAGGIMPIVPDGSVEIVLNLGDVIHQLSPAHPAQAQPRAMLVGQPTGPVVIRPSGDLHLVGIRLQPWASRAFVRAPAAALRNQSIDIAAPEYGGFASLAEHLLAAADDQTRLDVTTAWLRARRSNWTGRVTAAAVRIIRDRRELPSMRALAGELGVTTRTMQRAFAHDVGLGPKTLVRITRLQRAIGLARTHDALPWAAIAARCGYYDESHLNLDFQALAGCAPSQFTPRAESLTELMLESRGR
ncbi:MAG: helix-turn-helix transcriptional regulator [Gemmatimonadaceae bacterium]